MFSKARHIFAALSHHERLIFLGALIVAVFSLAFLGLNAFNRLTIEVPVRGGSFTEGVLGQPTYVNPVIAVSEADRDLVSLVFASVYDLAEKIEAEEGNRAWKVRLKENATWHDGLLITSDDIIFTIEKIQDSESRSPLSAGWRGIAAGRVSEREIRFDLAAPYAFFEDNLKRLHPVPKHLFADIPLANWRLSLYNLEPVGSGPYRFESSDKRRDGYITEYRLRAFDAYVNGRPYIDSFVIKFYSAEERLIQAFNLAQLDGMGGIEPSFLPQLRLRYQLHSLTAPRYYAVFWNGSVNPVLKEKNVRLALARAVNKDRLVSSIFGGNAMVSYGPIPPTFDSFNAALADLVGYSEETANTILDNSGWKRDEDGFRAKTSGREKALVEFNLVVPQVPFLKETAEHLKAAWDKVGVKANVILLNPQDVASEVIRTRNYEALLYGNILSGNPDLFSFWHSSQRFSPGLNLSLYENRTADRLVERIRQTQDEGERFEDLAALQSLIVQDQPALFLYSPNYLYVASRNRRGFDLTSVVTPPDRFRGVEKWYVKTARTFQ